MFEFTEENIQRLFGHEAAENESPERLKEYYFKNNIYSRIVSDLPIRILVGHKGIGKSALFKIAKDEDTDKGIIPVSIQPNDVLDFGNNTDDILYTIRSWTKGLKETIITKVLDSLNIPIPPISEIENHRKPITDFIADKILEADGKKFPAHMEKIIYDFCESGSRKLNVYVDDLDRGWKGRSEDITRISALLNAVRDLSIDNRNISFRIALRSDVYYLVRTSDESTDKIEGSVVWHSWTNHEILVLLIKRIETFFGRKIDEDALLNEHQSELAKYLLPIMHGRFEGRGKWENIPTYRILMSLIRKRPRDLVKLCSLPAKNAFERKSNRIETIDFQVKFSEYSQGRIQDTINEYESELSNIQTLLMNMKPNRKERTTKEGFVYRTDELFKKISDILEQNDFYFANGNKADKKDLSAFLYKINFLTARKQTPKGIERKYFEENQYLSSQFVDFGFDWEVHPAYRWALQPVQTDDFLPELTADESLKEKN